MQEFPEGILVRAQKGKRASLHLLKEYTITYRTLVKIQILEEILIFMKPRTETNMLLADGENFNPDYNMVKNWAELRLRSIVLWKVELLSDKSGYLAEKIPL